MFNKLKSGLHTYILGNRIFKRQNQPLTPKRHRLIQDSFRMHFVSLDLEWYCKRNGYFSERWFKTVNKI